MPGSSPPRAPRPARRRALALYVLGWAAAGALAALAVVAVLGGTGDGDEVALPPVRETELSRAAARAGCVLWTGPRTATTVPAADGPASRAAPPGVYDAPPPRAALVGALRRGRVVISHPPSVSDEQRERLRALQAAVPEGTLVVPEARMRFAVAIAGWRRVLACRRLEDGTLDALRLFRGRFVGSGPDSPG
jgi:hypothetical protein